MSVGSLCAQQALSVAIMVKNEEESLERTLQPYAQAGVQSILIYDTGSTDKTVDKAHAFLKKYQIQDGHVIEEPFVDFATSRNKALTYARSYFSDSSFILMPDAEWYINDARALCAFCNKEAEKEHIHDAYLIRILWGSLDYKVPHLIATHKRALFEGVVHESVKASHKGVVPDEIYLEHKATNEGVEKSRKRWEKDVEILRTQHKKNTKDTRTLFYLAQTYECLSDYKNAYHYYKLRSGLKGWDEEDFMTWLRLGRVTAHRSDQELHISFHEAYQYFLKAYTLRPSRIEPLIELARHHQKNDQLELAYMYASRACDTPYPEKDTLFVDKYMYDFIRWDILGQVAFYVKDYKRGHHAVLKALAYDKTKKYLWENLKYYIHQYSIYKG
jgi:glycosyltransferase involved in cell wall biosynthesis